MSRSGYSDDLDSKTLNCWRGAVGSACRGRRGQRFFATLLLALDALPEKRLIADNLQSAEGYCALGALAQHAGKSVGDVDVYDSETIADMFDIAPALARETAYVNDEGVRRETPEQRFERVRRWAAAHAKSTPGGEWCNQE